jgi:hypothetical protein
MALTLGNKTSYIQFVNTTVFEFSHNHNTTTNGLIVLIIASPIAGSSAVSSVNYAGVNMISRLNVRDTTFNTEWRVFSLLRTTTTTSNFRITFNTAPFGNVSCMAYSFGDADIVPRITTNLTALLNQTATRTIEENSMIIGCAIAGNNTGAYMEIPDGTPITLDYNHSINNATWGAVSSVRQPPGSITIQGGSTATNIMLLIEVVEKLRRFYTV